MRGYSRDSWLRIGGACRKFELRVEQWVADKTRSTFTTGAAIDNLCTTSGGVDGYTNRAFPIAALTTQTISKVAVIPVD